MANISQNASVNKTTVLKLASWLYLPNGLSEWFQCLLLNLPPWWAQNWTKGSKIPTITLFQYADNILGTKQIKFMSVVILLYLIFCSLSKVSWPLFALVLWNVCRLLSLTKSRRCPATGWSEVGPWISGIRQGGWYRTSSGQPCCTCVKWIGQGAYREVTTRTLWKACDPGGGWMGGYMYFLYRDVGMFCTQ